MPLRSLAFLVFFAGSTAATLTYPTAGVISYLVLYHVYPQTTWWGKSIAFLGLRYTFICGAVLVVGAILNANRLRFGRRSVLPVEVGMICVFLAIVLSTTTGTGWDARTDEFLDKMAKVFLFAFVMSHVVVTRRGLWQVVLVFACMALYLGHEAHTAPRGAFEGNRLNGIGGPDFQDSNGLAIHLCALLPFIMVVFQRQGRRFKVLAFIAGGYAANAILLCRTRSVVLAAAAAAAMSVFFAPRRYRRRVVGLLCLGLAGVVFLSDQSYWDRVSTIFQEKRDQSVSDRLTIWSGAWQMIKENPLGVGIGHFQTQIGRYTAGLGLVKRDAHNSYLLCAAETGFPGLAAYLATLVLAWFTLGQALRRLRASRLDPSEFELIIFANRLALVVYVVAGVFCSRFYTEGQWLLVAMTACAARAVENEIREAALQPVVLDCLMPAWQSDPEVSVV